MAPKETFAAQACANAEAAYTRTLTAASKVKLVGDCDGASVRGALDGLSDLPFMIGQVTGAEHPSGIWCNVHNSSGPGHVMPVKAFARNKAGAQGHMSSGGHGDA